MMSFQPGQLSNSATRWPSAAPPALSARIAPGSCSGLECAWREARRTADCGHGVRSSCDASAANSLTFRSEFRPGSERMLNPFDIVLIAAPTPDLGLVVASAIRAVNCPSRRMFLAVLPSRQAPEAPADEPLPPMASSAISPPPMIILLNDQAAQLLGSVVACSATMRTRACEPGSRRDQPGPPPEGQRPTVQQENQRSVLPSLAPRSGLPGSPW